MIIGEQVLHAPFSEIALTQENAHDAGGDALKGHTRSHPEHDG